MVPGSSTDDISLFFILQVTQMLSSRTLGAPEGQATDGTALVVLLKGAVLEE